MSLLDQIMNGRPGEQEIRERFRTQVAPLIASKIPVETRTPWVGNTCIIPCSQKAKAEHTGRVINGFAEYSWE